VTSVTSVTQPTLITSHAAAKHLGVSPRTLRRMAAGGRIPSYKIGDAAKAAVRFAEDDILAFVKACYRSAT
jgi:excisionase family DNA binding protein